MMAEIHIIHGSVTRKNVSEYLSRKVIQSNEKQSKLKNLHIWETGQKAIYAMTRKLHNEPLDTMNIKRIEEIFKHYMMSDNLFIHLLNTRHNNLSKMKPEARIIFW